jgi:hypothetical protein
MHDIYSRAKLRIKEQLINITSDIQEQHSRLTN